MFAVRFMVGYSPLLSGCVSQGLFPGYYSYPSFRNFNLFTTFYIPFGLPLITSIIFFSPFCDLTCSDPRLHSNSSITKKQLHPSRFGNSYYKSRVPQSSHFAAHATWMTLGTVRLFFVRVLSAHFINETMNHFI